MSPSYRGRHRGPGGRDLQCCGCAGGGGGGEPRAEALEAAGLRGSVRVLVRRPREPCRGFIYEDAANPRPAACVNL